MSIPFGSGGLWTMIISYIAKYPDRLGGNYYVLFGMLQPKCRINRADYYYCWDYRIVSMMTVPVSSGIFRYFTSWYYLGRYVVLNWPMVTTSVIRNWYRDVKYPWILRNLASDDHRWRGPIPYELLRQLILFRSLSQQGKRGKMFSKLVSIFDMLLSR
jgi:hypothetical protein